MRHRINSIGQVTLYRCCGTAACWVLVAAIVVVSSEFPLAYGTVMADPVKVVFNSLDQTAAVTLTSDGTPIPADAILGWRLLASDHDYARMFSYKKADGVLTLTPTPSLEVGSYDLVVDTRSGAVCVKVYTPLATLPDPIEEEAARTGLPVEEIKKLRGLVTEEARATVTIELPPVYYEGQTLTYSMPTPPDRECVWTINGEAVEQGVAKTSVAYTFPRPGDYVLGYTEKEDGIVVASASACTVVVNRIPIPVEVAQREKLTLHGPPDYTAYAWRLEGETVSAEPALTRTFSYPGKVQAQCVAKSPTGGPQDAFVRYRYDITVTAR